MMFRSQHSLQEGSVPSQCVDVVRYMEKKET